MSALDLRPEVAAFAQAMERKLRANDHKGGWANEPKGWLLDRAEAELLELRESVSWLQRSAEDLAVQSVLDEAADVANFCIMIADNCGALGPRT